VNTVVDTGLSGRVAIVTGVNNPHGIGAAIARALAAEGAKVMLSYYLLNKDDKTATELEAMASEFPGRAFYESQQATEPDEVLYTIRGAGGLVDAWEADLTDPSAAPTLFDEAEKRLGPVQILVNNAAHWEADTFIPAARDLHSKSPELWADRPSPVTEGSFERNFRINTRAVALMMAEFAKRHINRGENWGAIVNVSTAGAYCSPSEVSFGASKLALESYTRSAAEELGSFGITINTVSLGPIQTGWITPEVERDMLPAIPMGRVGTPDDVAGTTVFLVSEQARWITGQRLYVGGGHGG
jgi:3-oxoacyl-[acyl-carrier protein] reductase